MIYPNWFRFKFTQTIREPKKKGKQEEKDISKGERMSEQGWKSGDKEVLPSGPLPLFVDPVS